MASLPGGCLQAPATPFFRRFYRLAIYYCSSGPRKRTLASYVIARVVLGLFAPKLLVFANDESNNKLLSKAVNQKVRISQEQPVRSK